MIEIVAMVYRSRPFAEMIRGQLRATGRPWRIVANDPERSLGWEGETYRDHDPSAHYLARVYRCWNYCVESSRAEYVCLVNSDMVGSAGWLDAIERRLNGCVLPVSRLVEPGPLRFGGIYQRLYPGQHAVTMDFGCDPADFPYSSWEATAAGLREDRTEDGGLFMPCLLNREAFLRVGGYPEGNIENGDGLPISGDAELFRRLGEIGYRHVTCFDSLVYHFQEGEMRAAC